MRTFPKRSNGQDVTEMNIYESQTPLPDSDTRIHFAARLRHNSHCHGAAGIPIGPASIAGIIEETVADEMPFTDEDTLDLLANMIDPAPARTSMGRRLDISHAPLAGRTDLSARSACPMITARADGESNS